MLAKFEVEGDSVHVPRMAELAEMMADTAIWHKEECLAWMRVAQDKERELAAAKAASVLPVKFYWCYQSNECDIFIHGMNDKDSTLFGNWLDERMKERGEGLK